MMAATGRPCIDEPSPHVPSSSVTLAKTLPQPVFVQILR